MTATRANRSPWGPYLLVIAGTVVGLAAVAFGVEPWGGGLIIGLSLLAGAALRMWLPRRRAGALVVRARRSDVLTLVVFGFLLVTGSLAFLVDLHPT